MGALQQFSITLPADLAEMVHSKVASGEYASPSDLVREGLNGLLDRDRAIETWLHAEVAPAYDRLKADPASGVSPEDVRAALAAEHQRKIASR